MQLLYRKSGRPRRRHVRLAPASSCQQRWQKQLPKKRMNLHFATLTFRGPLQTDDIRYRESTAEVREETDLVRHHRKAECTEMAQPKRYSKLNRQKMRH